MVPMVQIKSKNIRNGNDILDMLIIFQDSVFIFDFQACVSHGTVLANAQDDACSCLRSASLCNKMLSAVHLIAPGVINNKNFTCKFHTGPLTMATMSKVPLTP